ncbi:MAG TPA: hypothetical protein PLK55_03400 [archaeon]|jgi:hypothetical protein|nr:hypothetical protein [archaeon]
MKKENTKIMLWAVVALVLGIVIGAVITNATIGNAKSIYTQDKNITAKTLNPNPEFYNLSYEDCLEVGLPAFDPPNGGAEGPWNYVGCVIDGFFDEIEID